MKRRFRTIFALTLCLMMILGNVVVGGEGFAEVLESFFVKADAAKITEYKTGDIIEFGWYPQTKETDSTIITVLNELGGDNKNWTSYNYYSGTDVYDDGQMKSSNYMRYKDVIYGTTKYRGVVFDSYRPSCTGVASSYNYQSSNGYSTGTTYWFKYEPIKWRVLDPSTGLVLSETILDSQAYNNYILYEKVSDPYFSYTYWGDSAKTYYPNDYAKSSIRQWLNNDFYNTAFSTSQQDIIQSITLDNSAYSTSYSAYDSTSTTDKIFLLSYSDTLNSNYGFSTNYSTCDTARRAQGSDYAKCQGLMVSTNSSYSGNSTWRLRSACYYSSSTCLVRDDGFVYYNFTDITDSGVRAALKLNLSSDIFQSSVFSTGDIIEFGWYPQTDVTSSMGTTLNSEASEWKSYKYYEGTGSYGTMHESDYMYYCDVIYGNNKYRGVKFNTYRPYWTGIASTISCGTYQDDNGYTVGNTYWFKYEPIKWRVLDPSTGLVLSDAILDSQAYNNYILYEGNVADPYYSYTYWGDSTKTYYANNYANSSIRQWLNNEFYNTAFSTSQQSKIQSTTLDNSAYSSSYSAYDSASTTDKIFLLSYAEVQNTTYGFTNSTGSTDTRTAKGSDYAKCQGLSVYSGNGNSCWRLRSAGDYSYGTCHVSHDGDVYSNYGTIYTSSGVRAALKLNLTSDIIQSDVPELCNHNYKVSYNWSADGKSCSATAVCLNDNSHVVTENANITSKIKIPATCEEKGTTTYTATFSNRLFASQTKDVTDIEVLNHDYAVTYSWASDGSSCTAIAVCKNNATHTITENAQMSLTIKTKPSCGVKGTTTYIASFANPIFEIQTKDVIDIQALTHSYTNYTYNNDAHIGVDGTETAQCDHCTETHTRTKVGTAKAAPVYSIKNLSKYNGQTIDYKSSLTIYADVQNCTDVKWVVAGAKYTTNADGSITINQATGDFSVYFTAKDLDGNTVTSETESVKVNTGFFAKLVAFFKGLFGSLPDLKQ